MISYAPLAVLLALGFIALVRMLVMRKRDPMPRARLAKLQALDEMLTAARLKVVIIVDDEPVVIRVDVRAPSGPINASFGPVVSEASARLSRTRPLIVDRGALLVRIDSKTLDAWTQLEPFVADVAALVDALERQTPAVAEKSPAPLVSDVPVDAVAARNEGTPARARRAAAEMSAHP